MSGLPRIQWVVETDHRTWHYPPWSSLPDVGILTNESGGGKLSSSKQKASNWNLSLTFFSFCGRCHLLVLKIIFKSKCFGSLQCAAKTDAIFRLVFYQKTPKEPGAGCGQFWLTVSALPLTCKRPFCKPHMPWSGGFCLSLEMLRGWSRVGLRKSFNISKMID